MMGNEHKKGIWIRQLIQHCPCSSSETHSWPDWKLSVSSTQTLFCEYLMYPNVRMRHWRAQSPEDRAGAFLRGGEPLTPGNILCCNLRFWWVADCYLVLLGVEKKIIIKPEVVSLKYFIHVKFFFLFSNAWRNPWDVQVWNLFLTKWPHMKPDTEGTGSDVELLQVLWQCKEQIWCECGGAQENSAASVHCEFQGLWWLPVINVI